VLVAVLGGLAWALGGLSSIAGEPPHGMDLEGLGGDLPPENTPESAPVSPGEERARSRYRDQLARLEAGIPSPRAPRLRMPRLRLPRIAVFGGLVAWARRRRRLSVVLAVAAVFLVGAGIYAFMTVGANAGTGGLSKGGTLAGGNTPSLSTTSLVAGTNSETVSWTQSTLNGTKFGQLTGGGYVPTRYAVNAPSTPVTPDGTCNVIVTGNPNTLSCNDNNVPTGRWQYTITNALYNWRGSESGKSGTLTVSPAAPTTVTFVNPGGAAPGYINSGNVGSLSFDVALPATSLASDTVTLTLTDPGSAHTITATASAPTGAGTVHFTGIDGTTLNQGTITIAAKATSSYTDNSTSTSITRTKDTQAPAAPTAINLANGGGQGSAFINSTNKGSVNFSVSFGAGSLSSDAVSLSVADTGNAHTLSLNGSATAGAGSTPFNGNNLTSFLDGTISLSATATDLAGNTSTAKTASFTKDTVAPDAPTAVAINNGLGSGSAYINNTNKGSVDYLVTIPSGANNSTTDTVKVTLTSGASVSGTKTPSNPGGTVTVSGINATSLTDGTVSVSAIATDLAGNDSTAKTGTTPKDVVAPAAPTAVSLSNGLGSGSAYINGTNKGSVNYSVTLGAGSLSSDTVKFTVADAGSAHSIGPLSSAATSGAGSVSFNANNLTTFNDGTITASATSTDLAGNTSGTTTGTNTKDVVAPDAPTAVAISNGGGQGSAYINIANAGSVSYLVTIPSGVNNSTTDTVKVTLTSGASVSGTKTPSNPGGTVTVSGINGTSLTDGTVSVSAIATDLAGNDSTAKTGTTPKDTVAPTVTGLASANKTGGTAGLAEAGDSVTLTFSEAIASTSLPSTSTVGLSAPSGNGKPVSLSMSGVCSPFTIGNTPNYLAMNGGPVSFGSSAVSQPTTSQVKVVLGTQSGTGTTVGSSQSVTIAPSASITDLAGNGATGTFTATLLFF
jgi:hypothetical protein